MANYATNIFHARTENKTDLDKIEDFLDDTFSEFTNRYGDSVDAEFSSRSVYPEEEIKKLVESLEDKDKVYIKILTYEFEDEYVSFRIFSQGEWKVKLVTEWVEEDKVKLWSILQQREIIKYCDEVIFTILQHRTMTQIAMKFVQWDVPELEKLKDSKVYKLRERLDNGDKLSREEKNWLTRNVKECCHFKRGIALMGYRFDFSDVLKRYFVKQHGHIAEYYAIDKTALRSVLYGRIEDIIEVQ